MDKIILHAHSQWSHDSKITLENWRIFMKKNSISKVYLTEHEESGWDENKYEKFKSECIKYSCNKHKIIAGLELNISGYHILAPNLKHYNGRPFDEKPREIKKWVEKQGSILIAAHPDKYRDFNTKILTNCHGIEIINTKHQYNWFFRRPTSKTQNLMLQFKLKPYVGQDIHRLSQYDLKATMESLSGTLNDLYSLLSFKKANFLNDSLIWIKNQCLFVYKSIK